jgi:catechol 2,3-dioxygenase-like lactoylglutathione lyase family enzyme
MDNARTGRIADLILNTADVEAATAFYIEALGFTREGGGRRLTLGEQAIVLAPRSDARPYPRPWAANDPWFQHFAIVVSDMDAAYARLSAWRGPLGGAEAISIGGPRALPASTGGVIAFKFRDPEGHPLELSLPPGDAAWAEVASRDAARVFLGIDHTALAVTDLDASLTFYRALGFHEGPRFLNQGPEQDCLDGLTGAVVDIATLFADDGGPHIELLRYRSPSPAPPRTIDPSDIAATVTRLDAERPDPPAALVDPDGHRLIVGPCAGGTPR